MGWYPCSAPVGYMNDPSGGKGFKEIKIDPDRFHLVRKMFDLMLSGTTTPPQILKIATEEWGFRMRNGKPMARSTIYRIFTDPFYYGEFEYPKGSGNWYKGKHKPMITVEEYDRIQTLLGTKGRPRPQKRKFAFTGLIRCGECGAMITAEEKRQVICSVCKYKFSTINHKQCPKCNTPIEKMKKPTLLHYVYYHCTRRKDPNCKQKSIEEKELQRQIVDVLERIRIPEDFHKWAIEVLKESNKIESEGRNRILSNIKKQYTQCVKKIDGLIDMRANGELTEEEFRKKKESLIKEKQRLEELLKDTGQRVDNWLEAAENVFKFAEQSKKRFETGDMETKKQILAALGSNLTLKDKVLTIKIEKPLILMEKVASGLGPKNKRFEPKFYRRENLQKVPNFKQMLRGQDSNLRPAD
ncbi:MAG: recombinase family protein [Elusimicrobia bacterium]|nr:recombinase family protein [Elusimicrobiota bacterium]